MRGFFGTGFAYQSGIIASGESNVIRLYFKIVSLIDSGSLRCRALLGGSRADIRAETSVDYQGTDRDNTRYSETGRALMLPDEIRQMPKFRQLLIITDTAPPVKAAFPPVYLRKDVQKAVVYRKPETLRFSDVQKFGGNFAQKSNGIKAENISTKQTKSAKGKRPQNESATELIENSAVTNVESDLNASSN